MEMIEALKSNIGILLMSLIGGAGIISMAFAAWFALMAHGDQQQMAKARNAFFGGIVGLILGGFAFAIPELISETVVQPSGGQGFAVEEAGSCDDMLRRELVLQPNANTTSRMNQVIRVIQTREDDCFEDDWDPAVVSDVDPANTGSWPAASVRGECFAELPNSTVGWTVDGILVPSGLIVPQALSGGTTINVPSKDSVRDVNDNILVYFGAGGSRPTDLARCWLYLDRDQLWLSAGQ